MLKKDSTSQNLRPIEVESPQPEERGRGLVTDSGTGVESCYSCWRTKNSIEILVLSIETRDQRSRLIIKKMFSTHLLNAEHFDKNNK